MFYPRFPVICTFIRACRSLQDLPHQQFTLWHFYVRLSVNIPRNSPLFLFFILSNCDWYLTSTAHHLINVTPAIFNKVTEGTWQVVRMQTVYWLALQLMGLLHNDCHCRCFFQVLHFKRWFDVCFFLEEALFVFLYFHLRNIHKPCH